MPAERNHMKLAGYFHAYDKLIVSQEIKAFRLGQFHKNLKPELILVN